MIKKLLSVLVFAQFLTACSGSSSSGGSGSTTSNKFSAAGTTMTKENLAPSSRAGTQEYYGAYLYKSGGTTYAGGMHFTLENNGTNVYFKSFAFDSGVAYTAYNTSGTGYGATSCFSGTGTYNASTNYINVANGTDRLVKFALNVGGTCTGQGFSNITNAGVVFSSDFSAMAGGNNSTFFFLAQKANAQSTYALSDIDGTSNMYWFQIDGSGNISAATSASPTVTVTNGTWTGTSPYSGDLKLTSTSTGAYLYRYSASAASAIDGGFIMVPGKQFLMGVDLQNGLYFAASK